MVIADIELDYEMYAVALKKGTSFRNAVNRAMQELYDNSTLATLAEKYGLEYNLILREVI